MTPELLKTTTGVEFKSPQQGRYNYQNNLSLQRATLWLNKSHNKSSVYLTRRVVFDIIA